MKYTFIFAGRTKGAIGIFYTITDTVEADNFDAAILKLYDKYEHIRGLRSLDVTQSGNAEVTK